LLYVKIVWFFCLTGHISVLQVKPCHYGWLNPRIFPLSTFHFSLFTFHSSPGLGEVPVSRNDPVEPVPCANTVLHMEAFWVFGLAKRCL